MDESKVILFLDDDPLRAVLAYNRMDDDRRNRTVWVTTASEAIKVLTTCVDRFAEVHLDHDLGGETFVNSAREDCGMEVVRFIESLNETELKTFERCKFIVHTYNYPAGRNMASRLQSAGLNVTYVPFGMSSETLF